MELLDASPHQLINMLIGERWNRVASAKGAIARNEVGRKGELISAAIAIIDNLRASLDHNAGGEISANLASLYDYMEQILVEANLQSDVSKLDEVSGLLTQIRAGWESYPTKRGVDNGDCRAAGRDSQ